MKTCVVPGSFDPFTLGHLDIVKRAAKLFDKVYVAIMINSEKKGSFDFAMRKKIAQVSCADLKNVEIITADGLLCELCKALGACAIVKGLRNATDFDYETTLTGINRFLDPDIETVFIPSSSEYAFISSTFVREMIKHERSLTGALHSDAVKLLKS